MSMSMQHVNKAVIRVVHTLVGVLEEDEMIMAKVVFPASSILKSNRARVVRTIISVLQVE